MQKTYTFLFVVVLAVLAALYVTGHLPVVNEVSVLKVMWFATGLFICVLVWLATEDNRDGRTPTSERLCMSGIPLAIFAVLYILARAISNA